VDSAPEINFDRYMVPIEDLKPGMLRLLEVDKRLRLLEGVNTLFLITSTDVIHS